MNKSRYIDTASCSGCALCCKSFQIGYSKKHDKAFLSEVERFRLLDTRQIKVHEDNEGYWVEFKIACRHLKTGKKGHYCEIYESKRPSLCEHYPFRNTTDCPHKKVTKVKNY